MIVGAGKTHVVVHANPLGQLDVHLGGTVVALVTIATHVHETALVQITD